MRRVWAAQRSLSFSAKFRQRPPIALYAVAFFLYYRPQRSCEGYVFTPVCLPQCMVGYHPRTRHPPEQAPPPGAGTPWDQTPPRADSPEQAPPPGAGTPLPSRRLRLRTVTQLIKIVKFASYVCSKNLNWINIWNRGSNLLPLMIIRLIQHFC